MSGKFLNLFCDDSLAFGYYICVFSYSVIRICHLLKKKDLILNTMILFHSLDKRFDPFYGRALSLRV